MLDVRIHDDLIHMGDRLTIALHRTLRLPDDGRSYPLPPGLGHLPLRRITDYSDRIPAHWLQEGGVFTSMYQREAMWIGFTGAAWKPNAVKVESGRVNAVTGEIDDRALSATPQNYLVCPPQVWLDGVKSGESIVRQFVAMRLGEGYSVEAARTGAETAGGLRITAFDPKPGRFPDQAPPERPPVAGPMRFAKPRGAVEMGLGAGGAMRQKVYPDPHGLDVWDTGEVGELRIRILDSRSFRAITGEEPPPTPIDAKTYSDNGLPWFELYDEDRGDVGSSPDLIGVKTIAERDAELGRDVDDAPLEIDPNQIEKLRPGSGRKGGR